MSYDAALAYIAAYWPKIIHSTPQDSGTLIGLPRPYLIPRETDANSGMFQEMYYWDSYFISLGVFGTAHEQIIVDIAENFAHLIKRFGLIPNGSRFYFLSRSQPPFFTQQIKLALEVKGRRGDADLTVWLTRMLRLAEQEHDTVWLGTAQPHHRQVHRGLSRYFDINYLHVLASCESGWDHSTRCDDAWLDHLPVDLNCILLQREFDMAEMATTLGDETRATKWRAAANIRRNTINELMWDEQQGFFFDYNWRKECINPHPSLAGFFALWAGVPTLQQAERMVNIWLPKFLQSGGLVTTLQAAADKQWAWPNGWAPLQWIVADALDQYRFRSSADEVRRRWCQNCAQVFAQTGAFWEKYNVVDIAAKEVEQGVYGQLKGFGWSNAIFADFARRV